MKLPWVSRERLAEAQKRLEAADAERVRLLDLLLGGAVPDRRREIAGAGVDVSRADGREAGATQEALESGTSSPARQVEAFSTPFDRMERRFAQTFPQGAKIPAKFMAKVN